MITVTEILPDVYVLKDRASCCANLAVGKEKALLFDTGCGVDDMCEAVRSITPLPVIVIASHGHFDHIGGSRFFERVYLSDQDRCILDTYNEELLNGWAKDMVPELDGEISFGSGKWKRFKSLNFDCIDLGDTLCRIVPLPGHTHGSVGVWIPDRRILFSGDALTPVMCLMFANHGTRQEQLETLERVSGMDFDLFLTSHHERAFSKELIGKMQECIRKSFTGRHHSYSYPGPPYTEGMIYIHSLDEDGIGIITEKVNVN